MPPVRFPFPSAVKLPANATTPFVSKPLKRNAYCPFNSALMVVDPGRIVTVAVAFFVVSPVDVAVTVTVAGMGTLEGAVYLPAESIVPQVAPAQPPPERVQV